METYGRLTCRIAEIVGAWKCAICPSKTPAGPPDGVLAKDRIAVIRNVRSVPCAAREAAIEFAGPR
jgi:hypothetical protein